MDIVIFNGLWMTYNILLSVLPLLFGMMAFRKTEGYQTVIFGFLWLIFLPNTIYLLTDFTHLPNQFYQVSNIFKPVITLQFVVLFGIGIITYFKSLSLFHHYLISSKVLTNKVWTPTVIIIGVNFLVAIAVTMGRIYRTNSWEVFTNPVRVVSDFFSVIYTVEVFLFVLVFWVLSNALYFLLKFKTT